MGGTKSIGTALRHLREAETYQSTLLPSERLLLFGIGVQKSHVIGLFGLVSEFRPELYPDALRVQKRLDTVAVGIFPAIGIAIAPSFYKR